MKRNIYAILIACMMTCSMYAQHSITGTVKEQTGDAPVAFATVALLQQDSSIVTGCTTDNDGLFTLQNVASGQYIIRVSFIGYATETRTVAVEQADVSLGIVALKDISAELGEVIVTGQRKAFQMKGGNIIATIENTSLGKETDMMDVLRKIPGMTSSQGELESFAGGKPDIYINGRKVQSIDEVRQLSVKDVKTVELNTNPGSEYDASVSAVLLIRTRRREQGFSMQLEGEARRNHRTSHNENIRLNYNSGSLNLFAMLGFDDDRRRSFQEMETGVATPDTLWRQQTTITSDYASIKQYAWSLGADYAVNEKQSLGIKYDGTRENVADRSPYSTALHANGQPLTVLSGQSYLANRDWENHINTYYAGNLSAATEVNVYADYLRTHKGRDQTSEELSSAYGAAEVVTVNRSDYQVFAVSPKLKHTFGEGRTLTAGADLSLVEGESILTYNGGVADNSETASSESKTAGYVAYEQGGEVFDWNAGLRYERVQYKYHDLLYNTNNIDKTYSNFFPSVGVSVHAGAVRQSFSYRIMTVRPNFNLLNNYTTYLNRFFYQAGNPMLTPQLSHRLQYSFAYKFAYLALGYTHNSDFIGSYFYTLPERPSTVVYSWRNFDRQRRLNATLNLRRRMGFYEPSLTVMWMKNMQEVALTDGIRTVEKPRLIINMNNSLHLPSGFFANIEYQYQSAGSIQIFTFEPSHV
ncbi:MAG: outer membrane beta-barrel protein, partial [Tannerella sp.]|nr:outer membrane beta-barrel protein [Tannerella sp.]